MTSNKYTWLFPLLAVLVVSLTLYFLPANRRVERRIYYYSLLIGDWAIETHRVNWATSAEKNVCTTVREQTTPPYSHDAVPMPFPLRTNTCLLRGGRVYLDFQLDTASEYENLPENTFWAIREALRLNHRFIRRIFISINGLPDARYALTRNIQ